MYLESKPFENGRIEKDNFALNEPLDVFIRPEKVGYAVIGDDREFEPLLLVSEMILF